MKTYLVKDLMVPLSEYATVTEGATLYEAVSELEKAQAEFDQTKYRHRAVLVLNKKGTVVGKISQIDALKALEPEYIKMGNDKKVAHFGFSAKFLQQLQEQFSLLEGAMENICQKAGTLIVDRFMSKMSEGEYIDLDASLDTAIHQIVMGNHQSLLVVQNDEVIGVLRLTDVFAAVFHIMKQCELT